MISKTAEYALRAVTALASETGRSLSADSLFERTKIPRRYLTRVMQDLASAGLVTSRGGPGGGYLLDCDIETLTILDVINGVDPLQRITRCPLGLKSHTSLCPLHAALDESFAATEAAFAAITIKSLLESTSPIIPLRELKEWD